VLRLPQNLGPAAARNRGLERALALGTDLVLFTDADCLPARGWARALATFLEDGRYVAAGGVTRSLGTTLLDRYHDFAGSLNGRWLLPAREGLLYATTCNLAVRAAALSEVRFDERFPVAAGEDVDFSVRLRRHGLIGLATQAVVRHDFAYPGLWSGLTAFRQMFRRYGEADPLLWQKHPELKDAPSEACALADLLAPVPPADPAAYRRGASSRVRPRRFRLPMVVLRRVARQAYRAGQAAPRPWRPPAEDVAGVPEPR
jgi:glycosyltransferase involved in cell wall biosynthesis